MALLAAALALGGAAGCGSTNFNLGLGDSSPPAPKPRVLPLAFAGEASYAPLTGRKGQSSILEPIGTDLAIERITWHRVGKLSCQMQVYKRSLSNPDQVAIDKSDLCTGASGEQSPTKGIGSLNAPTAPAMSVITAVRGCYPKPGNGLRLAALEAEISQITPDGSITAPQTGNDDRFGNGFEDCGQLSEWSRCPPGQVGIGVRTHFNKALGAQFIVGIELQCRAVVPASGVAVSTSGTSSASGQTTFGGTGTDIPASRNEARPVLPGDSTSSNSPGL